MLTEEKEIFNKLKEMLFYIPRDKVVYKPFWYAGDMWMLTVDGSKLKFKNTTNFSSFLPIFSASTDGIEIKQEEESVLDRFIPNPNEEVLFFFLLCFLYRCLLL